MGKHKYTEEQKKQVLAMFRQNPRPKTAQIVAATGVNDQTIYQWTKKIRAKINPAPSLKKLTDTHSAIQKALDALVEAVRADIKAKL